MNEERKIYERGTMVLIYRNDRYYEGVIFDGPNGAGKYYVEFEKDVRDLVHVSEIFGEISDSGLDLKTEIEVILPQSAEPYRDKFEDDAFLDNSYTEFGQWVDLLVIRSYQRVFDADRLKDLHTAQVYVDLMQAKLLAERELISRLIDESPGH